MSFLRALPSIIGKNSLYIKKNKRTDETEKTLGHWLGSERALVIEQRGRKLIKTEEKNEKWTHQTCNGKDRVYPSSETECPSPRQHAPWRDSWGPANILIQNTSVSRKLMTSSLAPKPQIKYENHLISWIWGLHYRAAEERHVDIEMLLNFLR